MTTITATDIKHSFWEQLKNIIILERRDLVYNMVTNLL